MVGSKLSKVVPFTPSAFKAQARDSKNEEDKDIETTERALREESDKIYSNEGEVLDSINSNGGSYNFTRNKSESPMMRKSKKLIIPTDDTPNLQSESTSAIRLLNVQSSEVSLN